MLGSLLAVCPVPPRARALLFAGAAIASLADLFAPFAVVALGGAGALRVATSAAALLATGALLAVVRPRLRADPGGAPVRDPRLAPFRAPALTFALFLVICAASAAVLFALKLGPGVARVREFYLGSEARFARAEDAGGLLQVAVPHLFAIPFVLFAASHLVGFARAVGPEGLRRADPPLLWQRPPRRRRRARRPLPLRRAWPG